MPVSVMAQIASRFAQRFEGGELLEVGLSRGPERVSVLVRVDTD